MNDVLGVLFGSAARVKILRLFLSNPDSCFTNTEIARHAKVHAQTVRKEVNTLLKIGLVKKQQCERVVSRGRGAKKKEVRKKVPGVMPNRNFAHFYALRNFVLNIAPADDAALTKRFSSAGKVKLIIVSGVFIQDPDSRVDVMIVGDQMNETRLRNAVRDMEAQLGRELRYAAFSTNDFNYRIGIYDRLIRDILDYPHHVLLDKLGSDWKEVNMQKRAPKSTV